MTNTVKKFWIAFSSVLRRFRHTHVHWLGYPRIIVTRDCDTCGWLFDWQYFDDVYTWRVAYEPNENTNKPAWRHTEKVYAHCIVFRGTYHNDGIAKARLPALAEWDATQKSFHEQAAVQLYIVPSPPSPVHIITQSVIHMFTVFLSAGLGTF